MTTPHTKTKYLIQRLRRHATALEGKIEPPTPEFLRSVAITMKEAADRLERITSGPSLSSDERVPDDLEC